MNRFQTRACDNCRTKKRRCDRVKPACGECEKRGLYNECSWPEENPWSGEEYSWLDGASFSQLPTRACDVCRAKRRQCDKMKPTCGECIQGGLPEHCSWPDEESWLHAETDQVEETAHAEGAQVTQEAQGNQDREIHEVPETQEAQGTQNAREIHTVPETQEAQGTRDREIPKVPEIQEVQNTPLSRLPTRACDVCRIKKRRCNRAKPMCGECESRGIGEECSWPDETPMRTPKRLKTHHQSFPTPLVIINSPPPGYFDQEVIEVSSAQSDQSFHTAILPQWSDDPSPQVTQLQEAVDRPTGLIKDEDMNDHPLNPDLTAGILRPSVYDPNQDSPVPLTHEQADHLVESYLWREYVNLPIFDLPGFQNAYQTARTTEMTTENGAFHGILNMVFGLAGLTRDDTSDADAAHLFARGQRLSAESDSTYVQRVQSYIIQSQYLHATGNPKMAWALIGFAIRTAQALGLQIKARARDVRQKRDRELPRRLWHSAMILERMFALQIGLSPQTPNPLGVPLPTHLDTDYIDVISGSTPPPSPERPSTIEFLTACARLYSHVEDILTWGDEARLRRNSCPAKKMLALDFSPFLKVDGLLCNWKASLPSFLQEESSTEDPVVRRQRNILRVRYLYIRLRLHRPLLVLGLALCMKCSCRPGHDPHIVEMESLNAPMAWSIVRDASLKCVTAAEGIVSILEGEKDFPPWESIDYIHACGTVFLAAHQCQFMNGPDLPSEISLPRVYALLDKLDTQNENLKTTVHRSRQTLETLWTANNSHDTTTEPQSQPMERIDSDLAVSRTKETKNNRPEHFGWIESLPIDLDA